MKADVDVDGDGEDSSAELVKGEDDDVKPSTPEVVDMTFSDIVHDVASKVSGGAGDVDVRLFFRYVHPSVRPSSY